MVDEVGHTVPLVICQAVRTCFLSLTDLFVRVLEEFIAFIILCKPDTGRGQTVYVQPISQ